MNATPILRGEQHRADKRQVYFIEGEGTGMIKVGLANCAKARLAQLEKASPVPLRLLGIQATDKAGSLEREHHARFAEHRAHGEWFRAVPALMDYIAANAVEHRWPRHATRTPAPDWLTAA